MFGIITINEFPWLTYYLKPVRALSLLGALAWNFIYLLGICEIIYKIYIEDKSDFEVNGEIDMFIVMVILYNIIGHCTTVPVNNAIIIKEFVLLF